MDNPFRNLHEAKEQFSLLKAELTSLREKAARAEDLLAEKETLTADLTAAGASLKELGEKHTGALAEHAAALSGKRYCQMLCIEDRRILI